MSENCREYHEHEDNEGLAPLGGGGFLVGYVDDVHGRGAKECPEYVPTRHELAKLAAHWYEEIL